MQTNPPIVVTLDQKYAYGARADIFKISPDTVLKLFKRISLADPPDRLDNDPTAAECIVRAVWDSECCAYETIGREDRIGRPLVAHYLGRRWVSEVMSPAGASVADSYCLDCAYVMRLIPGTPVKWGQLSSLMKRQSEELQRRWREFGICHLVDAGVFGEHSINAVIDFAMEDQFGDLDFQFRQNGRLSSDATERWGRPLTA